MADIQDKGSKSPADPLAATENMAEAYKLAQETWAYYLQTHADGKANDPDPYNIAPAIRELQKKMLEKPETMVEAGIDLWHRQATLWTNALAQMAGVEQKPVKGLTDTGRDKRFADEEWDNNVTFSYLKQSYLLASNWMRDTVSSNDKSLPADEQQKLEFFTERFAEAMSPSNVFAMNPQVLKATS